MEGFCRGCLIQYNESTELLQYTEKNRRMFVYATGLQVKRNDTFTFQLCKECYFQMKQSCKFKKQCRTSDKKFRNYLMLKEEGDNFGRFIKNMDENLSLRLPLTSGHSTPAYQKNKDDDNESTCTSIHNFMTDILEGEEMAPTEARIIREVIEEEADVLDDSLDSHWLQDDLSVASDFDVDFGISPFATPRSINNGSYTSRSISEAKQREINYLTSKEIIEKIDKPRISQKYDMPLLEMDSGDMPKRNKDEYDIPQITKTEYYNETEDNEKPDANLQFDNSIPSEVEDMVTENSISSTLQCFKEDILKDLAKKRMDIESDNCNFVTFDETEISKPNYLKLSKPNESKLDKDVVNSGADICIVINHGVAKDVQLSNELDYYVNKTDLKRKINSAKNKEEYQCTIDRNLAIALKDGQDKEFSLDQLIVTPAASVRSAVSTPTINNILFGEQDTKTTNNKNIFGKKLDNGPVPKYFPQVGQTLDDYEDDKSDILENLLKNNESTPQSDRTELAIKSEPENIFEDECESPQEINNVIKSEDHAEVLEDFLREDTTKMNEEIIDLIDPEDLNKEVLDQDLFKRPLTPPYDKYDLESCLCKICQRSFISLKSLKIHFAKTHNYKFPNLDPHRNKSQSSKIKLCDICGKDVKGAANYLRHMRSHDEGVPGIFQCDVCTATYKSHMALKVHMRVHNAAPVTKQKKKFVCETCGRVSGSSSHHKLHIRRHLKQISASCDICNLGFYSVRELNVHVRITHNFERPFKCPHCPNSYKRSDNLNQHLKQHLGIMPYKCDTCNVQFVTKTNLASHFKSIACIMKRKAASRRQNQKVTVQFGKGSIDKIKKMMQCAGTVESSNDSESNESELMEVDSDQIKSNQEDKSAGNLDIDGESKSGKSPETEIISEVI